MLHWNPLCPDAVKKTDSYTDYAPHALLHVDCKMCLGSKGFRKNVIDLYEVRFRAGLRVAALRRPALAQTGIDLLSELDPKQVVIRYTSGSYTAEDMIANLEENTDLGRQWISDLLRVSRDMLIRKALRKSGSSRTKTK